MILFELTQYEKMLLNLSRFGDCHVMVSAFIETENDVVNKHLVLESLRYLQKRHPFLNSCLSDVNGELCLKIVSNSHIELEWLELCHVNRSELIKKSAQFNCKLFSNGLQWRVQFIKFDRDKFLMNFVINLFVSDGLNATTLCIEAINILNSLITHKVCDEMRIKLEPIQSIDFYSKNIINWNKMNEIWSSPDEHRFILASSFDGNEVGFLLEFIKLDIDLTHRILQLSKQNNFRLTSFFYVIFIYTLKDLYAENSLKFNKKVVVDLSVNMRFRYKETLDLCHVRCHSTMLKFKSIFNFRNFLRDVKDLDVLIKQKLNISNGLVFSMTHNRKILNDMNNICQNMSNKDAARLLSRGIKNDFVLSNLGKYVNETIMVNGPVKVKELYCSDSLQSKPSVCPAIITHILLWNGELMVQLGANQSKIAQVYFERLIQLFKIKIDQILIQN